MTPLWSINLQDVFGLAECLYSLALDHDLKWAKFWAEKWENFTWVRRAMKATYAELTPEEKSLIEPAWSNFLNLDKFADWDEVIKIKKTAICNILDSEGNVVMKDGVVVVVSVEIVNGESLPKHYKFLKWW